MGVFFVCVVLCLTACQKKEKAEIEMVEGVPVVHNPKDPMAVDGRLAKLTLEEDLHIGQAEGRPEYMFSIIREIAVDDSGRIFISDYRAAQVKVFDDEGEYLYTIGKPGQGPDEFSRPSRIDITNENLLAVEDMGSRAIKFFTLDGKYVKSFSTATIRMFSGTRFSQKGYILGMATDIDPNNPVYELRKFDENFQFQKIIRACPTPSPGRLDPFFPVFYFQIDRDDNIVYGFPETYEIQKLDSEGNILRRILKDFNPVEISEEEKEEAKKEIPEGIGVKFQKHYPPFRLFTVDEEGRVIVQAREGFEGRVRYVYDVFDPEGRYIARFHLEAEPRLWKNGKMYARAEDSEGFQSVKRYRVIWE
jgi:hypothetical protein